jgi:hypothetical protein
MKIKLALIAFLGIAPFCVEGCAAHVSDTPRAKDTQCDSTSFAEVFSDPARYFGKTFCGDVMAVPTERILPVYPVGDVPPSRQTVGFFDIETDRRIRDMSQGAAGPIVVYVRAKIDGRKECFDRNSGATCVPFQHSFTLNVREFRLKR